MGVLSAIVELEFISRQRIMVYRVTEVVPRWMPRPSARAISRGGHADRYLAEKAKIWNSYIHVLVGNTVGGFKRAGPQAVTGGEQGGLAVIMKLEMLSWRRKLTEAAAATWY